MRSLTVLAGLSLLVFASCTKPAPAPTPAAVVDAGQAAAEPVWATVDVADSERTCTADADCALTTEDCCPCSAGGKQVAIASKSLATLTARRAPVCSAIACTLAVSDDASCDATARAVCKEGKCALAPSAAPGASTKTEPIK